MASPTFVAPSILSADFADIGGAISIIESSGADWIHLDVMDGQFVPNITFGAKMVRDIRSRTKMPLDVHLMIEAPERYITEFADAGADYITVHLEASVHVHRVVQQIRSCGVRPGVAIVPSTPASALEELLPDIDLALVMTVNPGFGGQSLVPRTIEKLAQLAARRRELGLAFLLEVDGGINENSAEMVRRNGAEVLVSGSSFFSAESPGLYCQLLRGTQIA